MAADEPRKAIDTASSAVEAAGLQQEADADETARARVQMLTARAKLDEQESRYRQLVEAYGGNRRARRRARAEVRKLGRAD